MKVVLELPQFQFRNHSIAEMKFRCKQGAIPLILNRIRDISLIESLQLQDICLLNLFMDELLDEFRFMRVLIGKV